MGSASAQTGKLYLTDGNDYGNKVYVQQSGAIGAVFAAPGSQAYALSVSETINTIGQGYSSNGQSLSLSGALLGSPYTRAGSYTFLDGASDGTYSYAVDWYGTSNKVYRAGLDWTNLTPIFNLPFLSFGITYNSQANTLWFSNWTSNRLEQYTLDGVSLGGFAAPASAPGALAYDSADNTLWMNSYANGKMYQFNASTRALVQTIDERRYWYGAEFQETAAVVATPEPASTALLATGLIGVFGLVQRRRSRAR